MEYSIASKILFFLFWPVIVLLIFYLKDREKFKMKMKSLLNRH